MRSDTQFSGILRAVKTKIRESKRLPIELGYSVFEILVTCALRRHPDWEIVDGQALRKSSSQLPDEGSKQQKFPSGDFYSPATPQKEKASPQSMALSSEASPSLSPGLGTDPVSLPQNIKFEPTVIEGILPPEIAAEFGNHSVRYFGAFAVIEVSLSLRRAQRVYATVRRNITHEKVIWLFSVCGPLADAADSINDIVSYNNECDPFKVTFLDMPTGVYVGVCHTLLTDDGWEHEVTNVIRNLAAFGDRLEELYWSRDEF
jgi:hypothetical protein